MFRNNSGQFNKAFRASGGKHPLSLKLAFLSCARDSIYPVFAVGDGIEQLGRAASITISTFSPSGIMAQPPQAVDCNEISVDKIQTLGDMLKLWSKIVNPQYW